MNFSPRKGSLDFKIQETTQLLSGNNRCKSQSRDVVLHEVLYLLLQTIN